MEFTFTKRNKRKLLHEGYAYVMDRTKADNVTIFWRCEKRGECKGRATYDAIFTYLNGQRDLNPETITIDFERAALNSISEHFPTTAVHGCFFPFGQCLWRNLQSLGLQDWYLEPENSLLVKTIQALAFVPPDDVIEAFQQLMDSLDADTDETLSDFLAYFESTWLGIVQRGRRRRPKFDVAMWNVYNRVGDNLPRTNN
ncbi:hypothetical protein ACOMHN_016326 [Nucella lapillus]